MTIDKGKPVSIEALNVVAALSQALTYQDKAELSVTFQVGAAQAKVVADALRLLCDVVDTRVEVALVCASPCKPQKEKNPPPPPPDSPPPERKDDGGKPSDTGDYEDN